MHEIITGSIDAGGTNLHIVMHTPDGGRIIVGADIIGGGGGYLAIMV